MSEVTARPAGTPDFGPPPYGLLDLDPQVRVDRGPPERVRCFVRGCTSWLRPPARGGVRGDVCPAHGICCHRSGTFSYADPKRNVAVSQDLLARKILRNKDKFENRCHLEASEDSVTWTVLRSFHEAGCLHLLARLITGREVTREPTLYLWGLDQTGDRMTPWPLLRAARERFEVGRIPPGRPFSEPDAALLLDGEYLAIVECKVKSPNGVTLPGPRANAQSLTVDETLAIYRDPTNAVLDLDRAAAAPRLPGQLLRYAVLGQYMTSLCPPGTEFYLCNLTRAGECNDTFAEFHRLVRPEYRHRVSHLYWEHLYPVAGLAGRRLAPLRRYMLLKTANLRPMFRLGYF